LIRAKRGVRAVRVCARKGKWAAIVTGITRVHAAKRGLRRHLWIRHPVEGAVSCVTPITRLSHK